MHDDATFALTQARLRRMVGPALFAAAALVEAWLLLSGSTLVTGGTLRSMVAVCAVAVAVAVLLIWRAARVRVVITRSEVTLRGVGRTRRVPFNEIAGFEIARRNELSPPRTLLRLTPGRHNIPRSFVVAAASPSTVADDWGALLTSPEAVGLRAAVIGALGLRPMFTRSAVRLEALVAAMNAALDERRGGPQRTADLLAAARPKLRTILDDD